MNEITVVKRPYVIMFKAEGSDKITTHIYRGPDNIGYEAFGLLIYDLVRQVATSFEVDEDEVWKWVEKERHHHTTDIRRPS